MSHPSSGPAVTVGSAARWAVVSVPAHQSARGLAVPGRAARPLPTVALLPVAFNLASYIWARSLPFPLGSG